MNNQEQILSYEQDEVQLYDERDEAIHLGKLRIIEKIEGEAIVEWIQNGDEPSDSEWAVISSPDSPSSKSTVTDVSSHIQKAILPISCEVLSIHHCKLTKEKKKLELFSKEGETIAVYVFHKQHADFFFDVIGRYVSIKQNEDDACIYYLRNKRQAEIDDKLVELDLVPTRRTPSSHPHHWTADAPKKVWGFFNNMKKDPYNTTLTTLSKVYDVVLYGDMDTSPTGRREEDTTEVAELLQGISGMDDVEPGFEILTKREQLAERISMSRLSPLTHSEFMTFLDEEGRINDVEMVKQRIFKGCIHPNLRSELWCFLLGYFDWNSTYKEREVCKKKKEQEYFVMKQQWKTISEEQENNFSGFRDRKSIIEKDVNRTDRNHPFYEGETNANLNSLNDVLMTYIMYNFDLGYVQGMSDLLSPILYVTQNEATAFWCFVGYMDRVHRNFDLDQSGMKQQLTDLSLIIRILDPEFLSFLEAQDSANLYFCFRWLLVRFKRELNYSDTMKLWEVLWTDFLCSNFHLCVAVAILDTERSEIVEKKFGFTDVLKHINGLSLRLDLESILKKAEAIHDQLSKSDSVPNTVRAILNIPQFVAPAPSKSQSCDSLSSHGGVPGRAERVTEDLRSLGTSVRFSPNNEERLLENGISFSYL